MVNSLPAVGVTRSTISIFRASSNPNIFTFSATPFLSNTITSIFRSFTSGSKNAIVSVRSLTYYQVLLDNGEILDGDPIKATTCSLFMCPISISAKRSASGMVPLTSIRGAQPSIAKMATVTISIMRNVMIFPEPLYKQIERN